MKAVPLAGVSAILVALLCAPTVLASPGPAAVAPIVPIEAPKDRPWPGEIRLDVDASDIAHRIVRVHETVTGAGPDTVLLYPQWLPGHHSPNGPIDRFAGLRVSAQGKPVEWTRDPVQVYAFHVHAGPGVHELDIEFQYLSPTSPRVGEATMSNELLFIDWDSVLLYPAGYYARQIPVTVTLRLPPNWQSATALEKSGGSDGQTSYKRTDVETLIDSPLYAGRYAKRVELNPGGPAPVYLNLFADRPELIDYKPEQLEAHKALVQQAAKLFGSHHYAHYDFLYSISDQIEQKGLEHHQSSENGTDPDTFTDWDKTAWERDLLAHEYTHSWNGKFRRPADLWTPNYNVPMQNSLLWVYEGQTQYWGLVLAARSGLRTRQQALDEMADTAAYYDEAPGHQWRPLQDTTDDPIINPRHPQSWGDWELFEDYYSEAGLIWLDVDTLIRERSGGKRSLDDFARAFFGINDGSTTVVTYTFDDIVKALNAVEPYDWAALLRSRLDNIGKRAPLDGLKRGGYRLVYTDTPTEFQKNTEAQRGRLDLRHSIGLVVDDKESKGMLHEVTWNGAAFRAGLTEGMQILAINGIAYDGDVLTDAIRAAKGGSAPLELIVKNGDRYLVAHVDYHDGLRYPHLERDASVPARLDDIFTAK
jgi:predicted metalloprotease with PDZ domain